MPPGHAYTDDGLIARITTSRHMQITLLKGAVHGLSVPILRPTGKGNINVGYVNRFFGGQRGIYKISNTAVFIQYLPGLFIG